MLSEKTDEASEKTDEAEEESFHMTGFARAVVAVCVAAAFMAAPAAAVAAPADQNCAEPGRTLNPTPWAQQMLGPERIWPFSRGSGITVAVLDSGVDGDHPQLRGRVAAGFDAVAGHGAADSDCLGTGTQVAGVIAARQTGSVGFAGMAPGVTILPIRVVADGPPGEPSVDPGVLARGIGWAVDHGADVIAVSVVSYEDTRRLRSAVADALTDGVLVVAAAGDLGDERAGNPRPYPAYYEGVIGVGAIGPNGDRWPRSQQGGFVDLVAPGAGIVTLQRGAGMVGEVSGTGVACGFTAASVALARAKRPGLAPSEIKRLLFATAIPAPRTPAYGHGIVNPYAAVNDHVVEDEPAALPALSRPTSERSTAWARGQDLAVAGTLVAMLAVLTVIVVAVTLPRGRRRFWQPVKAVLPTRQAEPAEPQPPALLFEER